MLKRKKSSDERVLKISKEHSDDYYHIRRLLDDYFKNVKNGGLIVKLCFDYVQDLQNWITGYRERIFLRHVDNLPMSQISLIKSPLENFVDLFSREGYFVRWDYNPKNKNVIQLTIL